MGVISFIGHRFMRIYKGSFSKPVIRIATAGISMSVAVMIVSVVIVKGFQAEIRNKVIGYSGHVRIKPYQMSAADQQIPLDFMREDIQKLNLGMTDVVSIRPTAEKAGILKTDEQIEGCMFKGVTAEYFKGFLSSTIVEGRFPVFPDDSVGNEVAISAITANRMQFSVGDDLRMYFLLPGEQQPRGRKFTITGIFDTGLSELDKKYMFGDLRHLQRLNQWEENQAGIVEILIDDYDEIDKAVQQATIIVDYDLEVWNVRDLYPEIFNWLDLLDMNVMVIIIIMLVVAIINIVTILLIRILEKTPAIGTLKSFGASNGKIRRIFLYISSSVLLKGLLIGNLIGFSIALLQKYFQILKLDQETYYVSAVPVYFDWVFLLALNISVFGIGLIVMVFPSMIISGIYPAKTLRLK